MRKASGIFLIVLGLLCLLMVIGCIFGVAVKTTIMVKESNTNLIFSALTSFVAAEVFASITIFLFYYGIEFVKKEPKEMS